MNLFDGLKEKAVAVVAHNMGYPATWIPSNIHQATQTAQVLFHNNTDRFTELGDKEEFEFFDYRIEYSSLKLIGLKPSVDIGTKEVVTIVLPTGSAKFYVEKIITTYDGSTFIAYLTKKKV